MLWCFVSLKEPDISPPFPTPILNERKTEKKRLAPCKCLEFLLPPGKERAHGGMGIRATKIQVKQVKALGISQAGLTYVRCVYMSMGQTLWPRQQKESVPLGFWSQLWKGAETPTYPQRSSGHSFSR